MSICKISKADQKSEGWSGGTTTQLAIYPQDSSYNQRNFLFRISTATLDSEQSEFTHLPEISREIMILEGILKIEHKDRYSKILKKFETDSFQGDWGTKGYGKVRDFNLMTTRNFSGSLTGIVLGDDEFLEIVKTVKGFFYGIYCIRGRLSIKENDEACELSEGDFVLITPDKTVSGFNVKANTVSEIAVAEVRLPDFRT
jgi:uncharacterized protein